MPSANGKSYNNSDSNTSGYGCLKGVKKKETTTTTTTTQVRIDYLLILHHPFVLISTHFHLQYGANSENEHYNTQQKVIYSNTSAARGGGSGSGGSNLNELDTLLNDLSNARYAGGFDKRSKCDLHNCI